MSDEEKAKALHSEACQDIRVAADLRWKVCFGGIMVFAAALWILGKDAPALGPSQRILGGVTALAIAAWHSWWQIAFDKRIQKSISDAAKAEDFLLKGSAFTSAGRRDEESDKKLSKGSAWGLVVSQALLALSVIWFLAVLPSKRDGDQLHLEPHVVGQVQQPQDGDQGPDR